MKTKTKAKAPAKGKKAAKPAARAEAKEEAKAQQILQAVHDEITVAPEEILEEDASIECPYCGEFFEVHVTAANDGHTITENCQLCSRSVQIHVEVQDGEFSVDAHRG